MRFMSLKVVKCSSFDPSEYTTYTLSHSHEVYNSWNIKTFIIISEHYSSCFGCEYNIIFSLFSFYNVFHVFSSGRASKGNVLLAIFLQLQLSLLEGLPLVRTLHVVFGK